MRKLTALEEQLFDALESLRSNALTDLEYDRIMALRPAIQCWYCDGKREYQGEPCLICVEPKP